MPDLPKTGAPHAELLSIMAASRDSDADWKQGRTWSLVYHAGEEHSDFLVEAYRQFFAENGLSPTAFPSLRRFEAEVVAMLLGLLGDQDRGVGSMTSGGTESILLAVKTYRDRWRSENPGGGQPQIIVPVSAHPAFLKAAAYFDIEPVLVPLDEDFAADAGRVRSLIGNRTICIVASAPSYPQGIVDPIPELGRIALDAGVGLHVDACLGGMLLPFVRRFGRAVPDFDLTVPGVTSMSVDLHKYGYAAKGASAVLYNDTQLHQHQFFVYSDWPGGLYGSPTMVGTRSGGIIAAAWASLMALGEDGYMRLARTTMELTDQLIEGVVAVPGMRVVGRPSMSVLAFTSDVTDTFAIARRLEADGWRVDRQRNPDAIHMIVTPNHAQAVEPFVSDLRRAVAQELDDPTPAEPRGEAMLYGVTSEIPVNVDRDQFVKRQMSRAYSCQELGG